LEWTKKKLNERFSGKTIKKDEEEGSLSLTLGAVDVTGEAYINNRKGKLIAGYELSVNIPFEATGHAV
jgi:activator of HSP90 ATPase